MGEEYKCSFWSGGEKLKLADLAVERFSEAKSFGSARGMMVGDSAGLRI